MTDEYLGVVAMKLFNQDLRHWHKAMIRAIPAGMLISLGAMFSLVAKSDLSLTSAASSLLTGLCFSLGLWLVVTFKAELFTGDCMAITTGDIIGWGRIAKFLGSVWVGNLVGAMLMALLVRCMGVGDATANMIKALAVTKEHLDMGQAFAKGIGCNFLVCCAVWLSIKTKNPLVVVPLVTAFVACGFEHSVANMFYWAAALMLGVGTSPLVGIGVVTLGNIVGALLFCATADACEA